MEVDTEPPPEGTGKIAWIVGQLQSLQHGLRGVEQLIRREIGELKTEQIADLRKNNDRLADDQRRLWESVRLLELDRSASDASKKAVKEAGTRTHMWLSFGVAAIVGIFAILGQFLLRNH